MSKQADKTNKPAQPKAAKPKAHQIQPALVDSHLLQLAREDPARHTPPQPSQLQRTLGNRALGQWVGNPSSVNGEHSSSPAHPFTRLPGHPVTQSPSHLVIQPKLTVNAVGDKYEQEAAAVAKEVVQKLNAPQPDATTGTPTAPPTHAQRQTEEEEPIAQRIQRQAAPEEEEMQLQRQEIARHAVAASQPDREALQTVPPTLQRQAPEEDELQLQRQETEDEELQLQRQELEEEEPQELAMLQREAAPEEEELQLQRQELEAKETMEGFSLSQTQPHLENDAPYNLDLLDGDSLEIDPGLGLNQELFDHAFKAIEPQFLSLHLQQTISPHLPSQALDEILQQNIVPEFSNGIKEKLQALANSNDKSSKGEDGYFSKFVKLNAESLLKLPKIDLLIPIPVPQVGLMHLEINTTKDHQFIGLYFDIGKLLSGNYPFKESKPNKISKGLDNTSAQRQETEDEEIHLQRQGLEEDPEQLAMTQRQPQDFTNGGPVDSQIEAQINQSRGGGQPMEDSIRQPMEQAFGTDFSDVSIHTDAQAHNFSEAIKAVAFTMDSDIYFRKGEYNPNNSEGKVLLAHELTHVVQQTKSVRRQISSGHMPQANNYSLSFQLPERATVVDGWNDVYTEAPTTMSLTLDKDRLRVDFSPALIADIQWPASNQAIESAEFNLKTGEITSNIWATQAIAINAFGNEVKSKIRRWMREIVIGTPLGFLPYDYNADPKPLDSLQQVVENLSSGDKGSIPESEIFNVTLTSQLTFPNTIEQVTPGGEGARISGTASATIRFSGSAATMKDSAHRSIEEIVLTSSSFVITKDGEDFANVGRVSVQRGGAVTIGDVKVLHPVAGIESFLRLLGMIFTDPLARAALSSNFVTPEMIKDLSPQAVTALATEKITSALAPVILNGIRDNCLTIPDVNLCEMLDI